MTTSHNIPLRRALLLACTALAALQFPCHAFSPCPSSSTHHLFDSVRLGSQQSSPSSRSRCVTSQLHGTATEEEDRSRPDIVVIKTHEDYVKFLEEDDRLCVIKYYATWCKSCQRFGLKFRHLAFDEGDHIDIEGSTVHSGEVRFAEVEYAASAKLCKVLKVKKLPTVHMHRKGSGKIVDMTCKPSQFQLVVDEMHRVLEDGVLVAEPLPAGATQLEQIETKPAEAVNATGAASFDKAMTAGSSLADEILASMGKQKEEEKMDTPKKEKTPWLPFTF